MRDGNQTVKLSVAIIHHNASEDLDRCLASLSTHAPACPHEIIVVDNASRDPGLQAVRERHPSVRWLMNRENVGYARGVNQALAEARTDYHLVLNPDVVVQPGAIDALLAFADAKPRAGVIGPQLLNEDGTIQDSCRRFYTLRTLLLRRTLLGRIWPRSRAVAAHLMRDFDHRSERAVDWVLGGCLLARREAVDRVGFLDERFFLYFEDVDWCFRMWRAGWEVLYFPGARFVHRHRRDSAKGALHRGYWRHLSSLLSFYEKWGMLIWLLKRWRGPAGAALQWILDMSGLAVALLAAYGLRAAVNRLFPEPLYPLAEYKPLFLFCALLATVTFLLTGRWRRRRGKRPWGESLREAGLVALLLLASTYLSHQQTYSRAVLVLFAPLAVLALGLAQTLRDALRKRLERGGFTLERTLFVGAPADIAGWYADGGDPRSLGVDAVGYLAPVLAGEPRAPLGPAGLTWLGEPEEAADIVERWRISQVVFWPAQGAAEAQDRTLVAQLRWRRIRLRWQVGAAWMVQAGARPEAFGQAGSLVLEPTTALRPAGVLGRLIVRGASQKGGPGTA